MSQEDTNADWLSDNSDDIVRLLEESEVNGVGRLTGSLCGDVVVFSLGEMMTSTLRGG